jgi:hypothetical protein
MEPNNNVTQSKVFLDLLLRELLEEEIFLHHEIFYMLP